MKKILAALLTAILLFGGCGARPADKGEPVMHITMTEDAGGGSQMVRNGSEQRFYQVSPGKTGVIFVSVRTESGKLDLQIYQDESDPEYRGNDLGTADFQVILDKEGEYTVRVKAEDFVGEYEFRYEEKETSD